MTVRKWASDVADWAGNHKAQAAGLAVVLMLALVVSVLPPGQPASPPELVPPQPAGGLLADLRGEDLLHRLEASQAALQQEMAWLRRRLAEGEGVSSREADLVQAVSEVQAEQAAMEGWVRLQEVGQMRLRGMVNGCQVRLEELRERLDGLEGADERN